MGGGSVCDIQYEQYLHRGRNGVLSQDTVLKMAFENKEELLKLRRDAHFL